MKSVCTPMFWIEWGAIVSFPVSIVLAVLAMLHVIAWWPAWIVGGAFIVTAAITVVVIWAVMDAD